MEWSKLYKPVSVSVYVYSMPDTHECTHQLPPTLSPPIFHSGIQQQMNKEMVGYVQTLEATTRTVAQLQAEKNTLVAAAVGKEHQHQVPCCHTFCFNHLSHVSIMFQSFFNHVSIMFQSCFNRFSIMFQIMFRYFHLVCWVYRPVEMFRC